MMATIEKYQTKGGATLYAVRYRKPDNKQTWKRGFSAKRDAQAFANTVEVSKLRGEYVAPALGKVTIGELGPAWLDRQRGHMKASSLRAYELAWRNHVAPHWSSAHLADVRYSDVAAWVADLSARRGAETVRAAFAVLARILDDAVRDRMLASNPARWCKLPKAPRRPNVYLSAEQLHRLADESGRYRSLVLLLGAGGLRWGEAAALTVGDVNFLRRRIDLHRNAVRVGSSVVVGTLKSGKNRAIVLPRLVINELAATAQGKRRDELLWPSASGSYLTPPSTANSWLAGAVARCRKQDPTFPRITAHDLRHTAASLAIHAGANPKVVQRMLGHASAAMTLDIYADLFESDLDAVADRLENVLNLCSRGAQ
jgi:integrase